MAKYLFSSHDGFGFGLGHVRRIPLDGASRAAAALVALAGGTAMQAAPEAAATRVLA